MSVLYGKKIIIIGDRDGISARTIEECLRNETSAHVVYSATEFFSKVMDLENQIRIKRISEEYGAENILLIIGTGDKESTRLAVQTVTSGDPGEKGVLAGTPLNLAVLHVLDDTFKEAVGEDIWEEHLSIFKKVLDSEAILLEVQSIRIPVFLQGF